MTEALILARTRSAPVGVFDSGVGGLSVVRHIRQQLPHESLLYFSDSAYAPYGDKPDDAVIARTLACADYLLQQGIKALVIACNTATAAAIKQLRARYPNLILVGVEPGLKPAIQVSCTKVVGVLATAGTLQSQKFLQLSSQLSNDTGVKFVTQAGVGLVEQIEKAELQSAATARLVNRYLTPLLEQGADTIVLGCTHYPFIAPLITTLSPRPLHLIDTGEAIARQLQRLLSANNLENIQTSESKFLACTSGSISTMQHALQHLLQINDTNIQVVQASFPS